MQNAHPNINAHRIVVWKIIVVANVTIHQDFVREKRFITRKRLCRFCCDARKYSVYYCYQPHRVKKISSSTAPPQHVCAMKNNNTVKIKYVYMLREIKRAKRKTVVYSGSKITRN